MQKVISINLNGNAYQLDESGYDALREYLAARRTRARGQSRSRGDHGGPRAGDRRQMPEIPRRAQVRGDAAEVEQIVKEMGPIDAARRATTRGGSADAAAHGKQSARERAADRSGYTGFPDGAMIAGVCNGLAAYFGVDVTFIRVGFVLAALLTKGIGISPMSS